MARGRGRPARGRGRGGRGRRPARVISSDDEQQEQQQKETPGDPPPPAPPVVESEQAEKQVEKMEVDEPPTKVDEKAAAEEAVEENRQVQQTFDMEADISQLEAPTFTTLTRRGPPEPMLRLEWNHRVNLIGEKVLNPMIYCCDLCEKPILVYGRMIPCKHVFCLKCARNETLKVCPRCKEKAIRVEQAALGTIFMCIHGGNRYESKGCRRTYLSQRDLQAHINHRHVSTPVVARLESLAVKVTEPEAKASAATVAKKLTTTSVPEAPSQFFSTSSSYYGCPPPVRNPTTSSGFFSMPFPTQSTSTAPESSSTQFTQSQPQTQSWTQSQYR